MMKKTVRRRKKKFNRCIKYTERYVPEDAPKYQIKSKFCNAIHKANYWSKKKKRCWLLTIDQVNWQKNVFEEFLDEAKPSASNMKRITRHKINKATKTSFKTGVLTNEQS